MVAQGRLLSMDILLVNPFNNTLQAIASGYFVAGAAHLFGNSAEPVAAWLASTALLVAFLALWRRRKN